MKRPAVVLAKRHSGYKISPLWCAGEIACARRYIRILRMATSSTAPRTVQRGAKSEYDRNFFATPSKKFGSHGTPLQSNPDFIVAGSLLNCSASSRKTKVFEAFVQLALLA
jgi:hypothetical protein